MSGQSTGLPATLLKFPTRSPIVDAPGFDDETGGGAVWHELIEGFAVSMLAAGRGSGTVRLRRHYINLLSRLYADPLSVTYSQLEAWLANDQWSPQTRKSARASVVMFYRWLVDAGHLTASPAARLRAVTVPRALPRPTPEDVFWEAYEAADERVRLMLGFARYAALRCTEICKVRGDDLDDSGMLRVRGKGGHERVIPIENDELVVALRSTRGYLFPGAIDGHLSAAYVSKLCSRALPGKWTAHTLRHAFASAAFEKYSDIYALAEVLGHVTVDTTRIYTLMPRANLTRVVAAGRPLELGVAA